MELNYRSPLINSIMNRPYFLHSYFIVFTGVGQTIKLKFKEAKNDLQAAMKQLKNSEELNRKKEEEYQETIAAMQRRIKELEGM